MPKTTYTAPKNRYSKAVRLPIDFNMEHLNKFAKLYEEVLHIIGLYEYENEIKIYTNGLYRFDIQMPVLTESTIQYLECLRDKNPLTEIENSLIVVYSIWEGICNQERNGFTKDEMKKLNEVYKEIERYKELRRPHIQIKDSCGGIWGFQMRYPTSHHIIIYTA